MISLRSNVGYPHNPNVVNRPEDVHKVRVMLLNAAARLRNNDINPGVFRPNQPIRNDLIFEPTLEALKAFQSRFMKNPTGIVGPGTLTWFRLNNPNLGAGPVFPFMSVPPESWKDGPRQFCAKRTNKNGSIRAHAGCDLYFPVGKPILAVDEGTVVKAPTYFYCKTYELAIYHHRIGITVRYGEFGPGSSKLKVGDWVEPGEEVGRVGQLIKDDGTVLTSGGKPLSMLHMEIYAGNVVPRAVYSGGKKGSIDGVMRPFYRLNSLADPTPFLDHWQRRLPKALPSQQRFVYSRLGVSPTR